MNVILRVTSINGLRFDITVLTLTVRPLKRFYPLDVDLISFKVTPPKTENSKIFEDRWFNPTENHSLPKYFSRNITVIKKFLYVSDHVYAPDVNAF